ncbi:histidine kinase [Halanaerobacter jeridensis]|uniref:Stage 0 sporulation protein A homolog n=1 Tax=Halanaerobacter jeridensis TaxID=706427 RepID=A0A939BSE5_9FIRM|nr:signal transduction histidine kinase/DNA-binding NarL/FixJ family response regulator [Halanaerobacter jeridensis]
MFGLFVLNHRLNEQQSSSKELGTKEITEQTQESGVVVNMILLGSLLILTVYYLILFILKPEAKFLLYLGVLGIISSIRMTALGEGYLVNYFNFSYNVISNILLSYYLVIPILGLLIFSLYSQEFSEKILVASQIAGVSIYVFILIAPFKFAAFKLLFELILLFFICYYLYTAILAVVRQRKESLLFLIGYSCFFLAIINEFWNGLQIVESGYSLQLGLFVFLLLQSLLVIRKFMRKFYNLEDRIQKLEKKNNALKQKDQSKDEFVNNTAQKLQLPLNDIISAVESIIHSNAASLSATVRNDLGLIINRGHGLGYMLNNLIDYFKLKQETIKLEEEKVDAHEIIKYVIKFYKPFINKREISFNNNIAADTYIIKADKSRLIQILYNLLDDVADKLKKGVLSFGIEEKNNRIQIKLKVNAENILFKYQDNISCFNCEEQIIEEKLDIKQSVTQKLIELQAGKLKIRKEANKTLVLTISLPGFKKDVTDKAVAKGTEKNIANYKSEEDTASDRSKQGKTVMIITNQSSDLEFWQETLNLKEYQLQIFTDRKQAIKEINNNTLLIILDLFALNKSDLELCEEIRDRFTVFELPILTMAARSKPENLIKGFELGINEFIRKPFVLSELEARIKTLITLKERVEESFKREQDFLRAQINPHFLYNTLDTIAYLCKKDPEQASDLIIELAQYLRYSFDFENLSQTISLDKELDLLKFYVTIQQARFPDKVKVEYEIEEDLEFSLPPLALQTIVENAIKHGILKQKEGGIVKIEIKELAHNFLIKVADNGVGMTAEKIKTRKVV